MGDFDPIPLVEDVAEDAGVATAPAGLTTWARPRLAARPRRPLAAVVILVSLGLAHGLAIWWGLGGVTA